MHPEIKADPHNADDSVKYGALLGNIVSQWGIKKKKANEQIRWRCAKKIIRPGQRRVRDMFATACCTRCEGYTKRAWEKGLEL